MTKRKLYHSIEELEDDLFPIKEEKEKTPEEQGKDVADRIIKEVKEDLK